MKIKKYPTIRFVPNNLTKKERASNSYSTDYKSFKDIMEEA